MNDLRIRVPAAAFAIGCLLVSAGCDIAMAEFREKQTAEWTRSYEIAAGGHLTLTNVNGQIAVEPASGPRIEIIAEQTARGGSVEAAKQALERVQIAERVTPDAIRIETKINQTDGMFNRTSNIEIRYRLRVPASVSVTLTTVNGGIELRGINGRVELETTNGGIKAEGVGGAITASTTNGGVDVGLTRMPDEGVKLECTNGGITLRLPADAKATINGRVTNGGIDVSGLTMDASESSRRRLDARLNGGGARIQLEGTNGGIRVIGR